MKLGKRTVPQAPNWSDEPQQHKPGEPYNNRTMRLLPSAIINCGKYKGKTLEYVMENDDWYYSWMLKNHLITAWGLAEMRVKKQVAGKEIEEDVGQITDDWGGQWMYLVEVNEPYHESQYL